MRLLKINGQQVDIDEQTAIGIDFQGYDIKEPGSRKVAVSNKFTIPKTANNMRIIGFAGNPQSLSLSVYNAMTCEYWNQNKALIRKGSARVTEIGERISVFAFEKDSAWTQMQDFSWPAFQSEFITWLQTEKALPSATSPFVGTFADFIAPYIAATDGVVLPFLISNLAKYDPLEGEAFVEDLGSLYLKHSSTVGGTLKRGLGGHFCVFCKTIFEFIEDKYGINLSVTDSVLTYNVFNDPVASVMYTPLRNLSIVHTGAGFYFQFDNVGSFLPEDTKIEKEDKTLFDFTKTFFQIFNCLIDQVPFVDGTVQYIIRRFDEIRNAPVIDLSGKISGVPVFSPTIDGYNQNNYIKFSGIYEGGDQLTGAKKIVCKNKNLDVGSPDESLFDIDAFFPAGIVAGGDTVLDISPADTLGYFMFFVSSGNASTTVKSMDEDVEVSAFAILPIAQLYSIDNEYNVFADMVEYPVFYKIKRWLSLLEVDRLAYFARYYVRELNGYFFLNKIKSYNPEKSTEATEIELIKIPD
jgi:hypothetical protein